MWPGAASYATWRNDDWIVFEIGAPDPAVAPFAEPTSKARDKSVRQAMARGSKCLRRCVNL
jgi:hypothetical protein